MSDRDLVRSVVDWVDREDVTWAKFTLEYPRFTNAALWSEPLKVMFGILKNTYPKSTVKKHRSRLGIPNLRHITLLGGDTSSGVALHAQGLVEVFDPTDLTRLYDCMDRSWSSAVNRQRKHQHQGLGAAFDESKIWVERFHGSAGDYLRYLTRSEGPDLGFGVEKIVLSATVLTAPQLGSRKPRLSLR